MDTSQKKRAVALKLTDEAMKSLVGGLAVPAPFPRPAFPGVPAAPLAPAAPVPLAPLG
jgi:hypothetical protein